jgi:ethanolamine ammonia-lyase small subunit
MTDLSDVIRRIVEEAVRSELHEEQPARAAERSERAPAPRRPPERRTPSHLEGLVAPRVPSPTSGADHRPTVPEPTGDRSWTVGLDEPRNPAFFKRLIDSTPTRIGTGRTGTRYRVATYLELRADHAIAKDAVYAPVPEGLAERLQCIEVSSRCPDRDHYLRHPNDGRRLSDESRALLEREGTKGADVQIIVADGLASPALAHNGPALLPAFTRELEARGLRVGRPILAHMARVGLQDDIGVLLSSRATAICLGERPGLGTGDSMSIYIAVAPKLDQDNAEKNCISNIRPAGLAPEAAARVTAELLKRGLTLGRSGLELAD